LTKKGFFVRLEKVNLVGKLLDFIYFFIFACPTSLNFVFLNQSDWNNLIKLLGKLPAYAELAREV